MSGTGTVGRGGYGELWYGKLGSGGRVSVRFGSVGQACWVLVRRSWSGLEGFVGQGLVRLGGRGDVMRGGARSGGVWSGGLGSVRVGRVGRAG